jgi:hypothetical protein
MCVVKLYLGRTPAHLSHYLPMKSVGKQQWESSVSWDALNLFFLLLTFCECAV